MALQALSIHLSPGEQDPESKRRKASSIEFMNFLQEQDPTEQNDQQGVLIAVFFA